MNVPSAIVFVNNDINDDIQYKLITQFQINEVMGKQEFDTRILVDPNYPTFIHLNNIRVMVKLTTFQDLSNRSIADIVIFVKNGLATIESNNFGPPFITFPIDRINIYALLRFNNSPYVVILPPTATPPPAFGLRGIIADELADTSGVHCSNPDNEYNNEAFKNRK